MEAYRKWMEDWDIKIDDIVEEKDIPLEMSGGTPWSYAMEKIKRDRCWEVFDWLEKWEKDHNIVNPNYVVYQTWGGAEGSTVIEGPLPNQDVYGKVVQPDIDNLLPVIDAIKVVRSFIMQL